MNNLSVIILAAGKGTRMKSDLAKVLHKLNNKELIQYVIDLAEGLNAKKIVAVIGHQKELVIETTAKRNIEYATQSEQLGTGHAVLVTKFHFVEETGNILVLSGDVPMLTATTVRKMIETHETYKATATILTAILDDATGYGRVVRDENGLVTEIVEEKDASSEVKAIKEMNAGIYLFKSKDLFEALPKIKNDNKQGEYYLPDVLKMFIVEKKTVIPVVTDDYGETLGINTIEQLKEIEDQLNSATNG